jgi:hypothetical protein
MSTRILIVLSALVAFFSFPAWVSADTCAPLGNPAFAATFEWQAANGANHPMSVRIAKDSTHAQILAGDQCLAICQVKPNEPDSEISRTIASITPQHVDMECSAAEFAALTGPATLIFRGIGYESPVIRFGTWLDGYREAGLKIQADRLQSPKSVESDARAIDRKPAIAEADAR